MRVCMGESGICVWEIGACVARIRDRNMSGVGKG